MIKFNFPRVEDANPFYSVLVMALIQADAGPIIGHRRAFVADCQLDPAGARGPVSVTAIPAEFQHGVPARPLGRLSAWFTNLAVRVRACVPVRDRGLMWKIVVGIRGT